MSFASCALIRSSSCLLFCITVGVCSLVDLAEGWGVGARVRKNREERVGWGL